MVILPAMCFTVFGCSDNSIPPLLENVSVISRDTISSLDLIDHSKNKVTNKNLKNSWSFVFFGFTHCPDVCPATLTQLAAINKSIDKQFESGINKQFLFVCVDPERDSLGHLAEYMRYFDPSFYGVTGEEDAIKNFEKQLGAFHRFDKKNSSGFYNVQHSSEIFLINPDGRLIAKFTPPMDIDLVLKQFSLLVSEYKDSLT